MAYDLIPAARISSSGLTAERTRMEVAANNIANAQATSADPSQVYKRKIVVFESVLNRQMDSSVTSSFGGVKVKEIASSTKAPMEIYNPSHPHADANGMLKKANISPLEELVDMMTATRAYEANLSIMKQSKAMAQKMIDLGKG